jgi:hypothetical protein
VISRSLSTAATSAVSGTFQEIATHSSNTRYTSIMRDRDPAGEGVLRQVERILEQAGESLYSHFDVFIIEAISTRYDQASLKLPPMLAGYIEYCRDQRLSLNILDWIENEKQQHVVPFIPPLEITEITAIGTIVHVLTRVQHVKGEQAKIAALSEADNLKNLFALLPQDKASLLAHIFAEQLNVIIRP